MDTTVQIPNDNKGTQDSEENLMSTTERKPWNNKIEFILSSVAYAVGLGNIWRFPYIAYTYGGGSFLIPYAIMVIVVGFPTFFLELALGQWSGQGPIKLYGRLSPALKGIGFGMAAITFFEVTYYTVIVSWALFYLVSGFQSELPWSTCANDSAHCHDGPINDTMKEADPYAVGPAEDYFNHALLGFDKAQHNWRNLGEMQLTMVLSLAGAWVIASIIAIKGVQSIGKAAYFTAIFPYLMLTVLLIYGMVFDYEGAAMGIVGYVTPDWEKVLDIEVWKQAASQIIFSLSVGLGIIGTSSSYNKFDNNCFHDAIAVVLINCATSVFAGFVVFSYLGIMAHQQGLTDVKDAVEGGIGLVFKVFPDLLTKLGAWPVPQILSFLLFAMVTTLGMGSVVGLAEVVTTGITDHLQSTKLKRFWFSKKPFVTVATCFTCFILGLSMCCRGGFLVLDLFDRNIVGWAVLLLILLEVVLVAWLYGFDNFFENIKEMGIKESMIMKTYLKLTWCYVTPMVLLWIIVSFLSGQSTQISEMYKRPGDAEWIGNLPGVENITIKNTTIYQDSKVIKTTVEGNFKIDGNDWKFEGDGNMSTLSYIWPDNIQFLGWAFSLTPVIILTVVAVYQVFRRSHEGRKPWKGWPMFQPTDHWQPNDIFKSKASLEEEENVGETLLKDLDTTRRPVMERQISANLFLNSGSK